MVEKNWKVIGKVKEKSKSSGKEGLGVNIEQIVKILLKNRKIINKKQRDEFFNPKRPNEITTKSLGIDSKQVSRFLKRIEIAYKNKEKIIIYGDYDADGICATAILWESLYSLGFNVLPYIPERFSEGYGINGQSIEKLKIQYPDLKLIITVDNGIVAHEGVDRANELGIDVIITDHHQKERKLPKAYSIIHSTDIAGAGISWIVARQAEEKIKKRQKKTGLELAAIGTIADQIPLLGPNRSFVKYGLNKLNKTNSVGLLALFKEAALEKGSIGTYEIGYIVAPRINAMGRLKHAIDSLRLLCTKDSSRAKELADYLGKTNKKRQKIVSKVVEHTKNIASKRKWEGVVVVSHKSYHEGVIGLAASKLVEEFWKPSIVLSKGKEISKASARSVPGFDIIKTIRKFDDLIIGGGGHPMAAGFSIKTKNIDIFAKKIEKLSAPLLTKDILLRTLKIDIELRFSNLNWNLLNILKKFEPSGLGNFTPVFASYDVNVLNVRAVGFDKKHLKLVLEQDGKVFDAIAFGMGDLTIKLTSKRLIDVAYSLEENIWNGQKNLQLKIKDIKLGKDKKK